MSDQDRSPPGSDWGLESESTPQGSADQLTRFMFDTFPVRGHYVHLDASWRALIAHQEYPPLIREVLAEAMAATALLVATLKFDGVLTLQMQGDGPMHLLVVQGTAKQSLRGVARYTREPGSSDLRELLGHGQMTVTLENADRSSRYQGVVPLVGARIAECLEEYFRRSEQLPSRLWLSATPTSVAGLLLQRLPVGSSASSDDDLNELAEADDDWKRVVMLAQTVNAQELLELSPAHLLHRLFNEEVLRVYESVPVFFQCGCSRDRVANILRSLGPVEVQSILDEQGQVEVRCEFCSRAFSFDAVDALAVCAPASSVLGTAGPQ